MSQEFQYKVTEVGFYNNEICKPGRVLVAHGKPLVKASWYRPINDNAKKAWGEPLQDKPASNSAPAGGDDKKEGEGDEGSGNHNPDLIMDALAQLSHDNDEHWTKDDRPDLKLTNELYQGKGKLTRADVDALGYVRVKKDAE